MIGHEAYGASFTDLAAYLEHGGDGTRAGRITWLEARNVWAPTVADAAGVMSLTASGARTRTPVYHLSVSFDPEDAADRAVMLRVADRLLADLGLAGHRAVIVAHGDRAHAHFHLMVSRVAPGTGRVWKMDFSRQAVECSLRHQERELGLRENPGHLYRLPGQDRPDRSRSLGPGVLRRRDRTGERPFVESARAEVAGDFAIARGFADLEARLAANGYWLEDRPRGLVVTDGTRTAAVSSVAPAASRSRLETRFGETYAAYAAGRGPGDGALAPQTRARSHSIGPWAAGGDAPARRTGPEFAPAAGAGQGGIEGAARAADSPYGGALPGEHEHRGAGPRAEPERRPFTARAGGAGGPRRAGPVLDRPGRPLRRDPGDAGGGHGPGGGHRPADAGAPRPLPRDFGVGGLPPRGGAAGAGSVGGRAGAAGGVADGRGRPRGGAGGEPHRVGRARPGAGGRPARLEVVADRRDVRGRDDPRTDAPPPRVDDERGAALRAAGRRGGDLPIPGGERARAGGDAPGDGLAAPDPRRLRERAPAHANGTALAGGDGAVSGGKDRPLTQPGAGPTEAPLRSRRRRKGGWEL